MTKRVTPKEAAELLESGWTYLDVRSVPEFEDSHPAGAFNVPLLHMQGGRMTPNPDFQRVVEACFPRDTKLVVGCKSGGRSLQASALLASLGYPEVIDVRGGFAGERDALGRAVVPGWAEEGLPTEAGAPAHRAYSELAKRATGSDADR